MNTTTSAIATPKKPSSVRHTRAIARDRSKRPPVAPPDEQVSARLTELIHPLTLSQVAHYHDLGLRARILSLPVMVALVLSMIWRQIGAVCTLTRLLHDEGFMWTAPTPVSQHALFQRPVFPAALFARSCTTFCHRCRRGGRPSSDPSRQRWPGRTPTIWRGRP